MTLLCRILIHTKKVVFLYFSPDKVLFTRTVSVAVSVAVASKFIIVPMVMDQLTDTMGLKLIPSVNVNLTVTVTEKGMGTVRVSGP